MKVVQHVNKLNFGRPFLFVDIAAALEFDNNIGFDQRFG
jgi:hypothetical protein